jgi:hypothetical protein
MDTCVELDTRGEQPKLGWQGIVPEDCLGVDARVSSAWCCAWK